MDTTVAGQPRTLKKMLQHMQSNNGLTFLSMEDILGTVSEWIDEVDNWDEHSWAANLQEHLR